MLEVLMAKDLFTTLDLNLLKIFQIIYQERNLSRAAERMHVTQPAVSKALAKLRHHFGDELFIRSYHGLLPTDFAQNLYKNLGPAISSVSDAVNSTVEFKPEDLSGQLRISISPFLIHAIGNALYNNIHQEAPDVQLLLLNWSSKTLSHIHNKEIDLGLNYIIDNSYKDVVTERLGEDKFSIYVRKNHPFTSEFITGEQLSQHQIVTVVNADWNFTESIAEIELKKRGLPAHVTLRSELPSVLVNEVLNSDAMFPSSSFLNHNKSSNLRKISLSSEDDIAAFPVVSYSHKQLQNTKKQTWLLNHIKALLNN